MEIFIFVLALFEITNGQLRNPFQPSFSLGARGNMQMNNDLLLTPSVKIPFPQCVQTETASILFHPLSIQQAFLNKVQQEETKLQRERAHNDNIGNNNILDFDVVQLRSDNLNGPLLARSSIRLTEDIMQQLQCQTNASVSDALNRFLKQFRLPSNVCAFNPNADCTGLTKYRTITGVCNNLQRPYQGSSQTAFGRLLPAAYEDGISAPRSQSVLGGPLPGCREISLAMGSTPVSDQSYNNFFVTYGQFVMHDITLATPMTDSGRTPITSCTCDSSDPSMCTVIPISATDPAMAGQKCMSLPVTTESFSDQTCSLGIKEQMNGNSHYLDLSVTYGSTKGTSNGLRLGQGGLLKVAKKQWSKFDLPPGQREGDSCIDSTTTEKCFAGGDSRLMENIVLAGIQSQWIRAHNSFAEELAKVRPDWINDDNTLYEESKKVLSALHQKYIYEDWLPILIGSQAVRRFVTDQGLFSRYNPSMPGILFNEAVGAVMRLHTLVRDLYSRCRPDGQLIDRFWLHDVTARCKLAYDAINNGVDAFVCGALHDFGFAADSNYAQEIHHRLFETNTGGRVKRHDIVSINICRGREHGIPGYNNYRPLCGLRRAREFQDFSDTMSMESILKLQSIYQHPDDVDLFVGVNHEIHVSDGLVGPVSACIIGLQMQHLKYGDRLFYSHEGEFTPDQLRTIKSYPYSCFVCSTTDIDSVPQNVFRPPNDLTNPSILCSQCPKMDFSAWQLNPSRFG